MKKLPIFAAILSIIVILQIFPQTIERKKPKIKNFGSSLDRKPEENLTPKKDKKKSESDDDIIRIDSNLVVTECLVIDKKGNSIYGLTKEDFIVTENGQPQEIQTFTLGDDSKIPRSIVLIIDYSGSQLPYIERSVDAAKLMVDKLHTNDLMAIVTDDVEIVSQFTSDKEKLKKELNSQKKHAASKSLGKSLQFSSLYAVLNEMFDEEDVRPIILFQTDGDQLFRLKGGLDELWMNVAPVSPYFSERMVKFSFNDLLQKVEKTRATIYTIVPGIKTLGLSEEEKKEKLRLEAENNRKLYEKFWGRPWVEPKLTLEMQERAKKYEALIKQRYPNGLPDTQEMLFGMSKLSGGWIDFLEKPEDADVVYSRILSEINTRYIIGFSPTNEAKDGKRRAINIEVKNHPEYSVWGRKSYIAPLPE
ncbi:MAG: VWA domain-containing protein [Pyrinomonadaceae bacterium]|nr:VWA domain-containing protein [Pyrinomonadaceae bacterium]